MNNPKRTSIFLIITILIFVALYSQNISEFEIKAVLVEKFTRFVEWETIDDFSSKKFTITILGNNNYKAIFDKIYSKRKIKDMDVHLNYSNDLKNIDNSDLIFITDSYNGETETLLNMIDNKPVLTISERISDKDNNIMIIIYVENQRITYDVNFQAVEKSGLKMSSLLLQAATTIKR